VVVVYHWLPELQMALVAQQAQTEAFRGTYVALGIIGASALVATLVAVFSALALTPTIATPLANLAEAAARIAGGDLELHSDVARDDEIGALALAFNSMTARLRELLKSERVARLEAEEAARLKDLFLATMSHELRTPLNAIIGFLGLILYSEQLDQDNVFMAERAMANSERLLNLINNILDLSRIASGRLEIIPAPMSPHELVENIQRDMELQVREKGLAFTAEVDPSLPSTIMHDQERITQIIINLVGNAVKFTEQGGIHLRLLRKQFDLVQEPYLVIEVADTGIGIAPSKQQLIFDEFTQVDMASTRKHSGAGLGLSIIKRLAILMHGSVRVISDVGQGSTFTVELPLELAPRPAPEAILAGA
jgi:signal transduction histidine kinase